jgi:hypothetical protein
VSATDDRLPEPTDLTVTAAPPFILPDHPGGG